MSYSILPTHRFDKEIKRLVKKYPSLKEEFGLLIDRLLKKPATGTAIGNDCYKIRLAISSKGKGKSGGARVITYVYVAAETIYLLSIYDKAEQENLKQKELKLMIESLELE